MDKKTKDLVDKGIMLPLMEEFYTIQGEGSYTGTAAYFIRVGGCDVGCHWCDVKESWDANLHPPTLADTIIDNVKMGDKVMSEEIFGPVLPVIGYDEIDEAIDIVNTGEKPLALYIFSNNLRIRKKILNNTTSGGVCINEPLMHIGNPNLPFGGVGNSGMGAYNGKTGFDTFSHKRSVMTRSFIFDVKQKYAPFTPSKTSFIKFALKRLF